MSKRKLEQRLKHAMNRLDHETLLTEQARDRKRYWQRVVNQIAQDLELSKDGQLELKPQKSSYPKGFWPPGHVEGEVMHHPV